jgi:cohesin complex subunit SA-1/2
LHGSENGQKSRSGSPLPQLPPVAPSDGEEQGEPSNDIVTPTSSLKRPRTEDDEASGVPNGTSDPDQLINVDGTPDMQIRRKRIRH